MNKMRIAVNKDKAFKVFEDQFEISLNVWILNGWLKPFYIFVRIISNSEASSLVQAKLML